MKKLIIPVLIGMATLVACNKTTQSNSETTASDAEQTASTTLEVGTKEGCLYTDVTAVQADGTPVALSDLVGKTDYLLVDFWASWCGPCRRLLPVLKQIYLEQPEGKLAIVGISVDDEKAAWLKALDEEQLPWLQLRDELQVSAADVYGVQYIPNTFLINKEGVIVAANAEESELKEILSK